MKADVIINAKTNEEANYHTSQLKRYGYKRIANCYWAEIWQKSNGWTVVVNRDF